MRNSDLGLGLALGCALSAVVFPSCSSGSSVGAPIVQPAAGSAGRLGTGGSGGRNGGGGEAGEGVSGDDSGNQSSGGSAQGGSGGGAPLPPGAGVGDDCSDGARCRAGLECLDGVCTPAGSLGPGDTCVIQPECQASLQCIAGNCVPEGEGAQGDACILDDDCEAGQKCTFAGLTASCQPQGNGDVGADCSRASDCFAGLTCANGACSPQPPGIPVWPGVDCDPPTEGRTRAYFEVPGAPDADTGDFFRLPFPNDALRSSQGLDLSGFPRPGSGILGVDPVELYLDALSDDDGWGTYHTVFFRFSGTLDLASLRQPDTMSWVDVTPGAPELGSSAGFGWFYSGGGNAYLCHNWIGVRRPRGVPLLPGHTYAVWLTTDVLSENGEPARRADNLLSVLAGEAPEDETLARVHEAYAPFRAYLESQNISAATVLTATVFTVDDTRDTMAELAEAVEELPAPSVVGDWVKCADGVESPCPDHEGSRNCGPGTSDYDEYHALVRLPIFQAGTPPYLTPADGGGIAIEADPPTEDVCLALTVPTQAAPVDGHPLVVFAHGTGGSFRSHVDPDISGVLSSGAVKFAVLGIDQVSHGPRRGESTETPDNLFFNFLNPAAARGNPLQGAADQLSLAKFAATLDGSGALPARIDPARIAFFGHSQGATQGSLMLPYGDAYRGAVLSGNGASLMNALLTKTEPVDIAGLLPLALSDLQGLTGDLGEYHPVMSLLQQWIDPADPLNFAAAAASAPLEGHVAKHVFQTYGTSDHYSPPITLATYAAAAGLTEVNEPIDDLELRFAVNLPSADPPLSANAGMDLVTLGLRQYRAASGSDGHFVAFDVSEANADVVRFLSGAVSGSPPAIGAD